MSRRISWRVIAVGVAVLLLGIAAFVVFGQGEPGDTGDESSLAAEERDDSSGETDESTEKEPWTASSPLVATNDAGEVIPPKSTTKKPTTPATPANPASPTTPDTPATPPGGLTPEEQAYLDETKKVVEENTGNLAEAVDAIAEAMSDGDKAALTSMLAGDESNGGGFAATLAETYPPFLDSSPGANVSIFATPDTTIYFAYVLVTWEDGGITSQHTVPVPLRFVDGEWRLTSLGDTADDLQFVQSVTL